MKTVTFTEFRKNASGLFSDVEHGEVLESVQVGEVPGVERVEALIVVDCAGAQVPEAHDGRGQQQATVSGQLPPAGRGDTGPHLRQHGNGVPVPP